MRDLGSLGGQESRAVGISDAGQVVGWSLNGVGRKRAFKWTAAGGMRALPTLAPGKPCAAHQVNRAGWVVGWCKNAAGKTHAALWAPSGRIRDLGTLPGGGWSEATGINESGAVVGNSTFRLSDGTITRHPFRWTAAQRHA